MSYARSPSSRSPAQRRNQLRPAAYLRISAYGPRVAAAHPRIPGNGLHIRAAYLRIPVNRSRLAAAYPHIFVDRPSACNHVFPQLSRGRIRALATQDLCQPPPALRDRTPTTPRRYQPTRPLIALPLRDVAASDPTPLRPACSSSVEFRLSQAKPGMSSLPSCPPGRPSASREVSVPRAERDKRAFSEVRRPRGRRVLGLASWCAGHRSSARRRGVRRPGASARRYSERRGGSKGRAEAGRAWLAGSARTLRSSGARGAGAVLRSCNPRRASSSCRMRSAPL